MDVPDIIHMLPATTSYLMIIWNLCLSLAILFLIYMIFSPSVPASLFNYLPLSLLPGVRPITEDAIENQLNIVTFLIIILNLILMITLMLLLTYCYYRPRLMRAERLSKPDDDFVLLPPQLNNQSSSRIGQRTDKSVVLEDGTTINIAMRDPNSPSLPTPSALLSFPRE